MADMNLKGRKSALENVFLKTNFSVKLIVISMHPMMHQIFKMTSVRRRRRQKRQRIAWSLTCKNNCSAFSIQHSQQLFALGQTRRTIRKCACVRHCLAWIHPRFAFTLHFVIASQGLAHSSNPGRSQVVVV